MIDRAAAVELLYDWVTAEPLRRHCLAVEASLRECARRAGADEELWGITGLLHDADYERYPDLATGHPRYICAELEARGEPAEMIHAIASHAPSMAVPRATDLDRSLFAVDELSGFVTACAMVRPQRLQGLGAKSVRKKLRQPSFAAAVSRDDVAEGAAELGIELDALIALVVEALTPQAAALGLLAA